MAEHWVEEPKPEYPAADHWQEQEHQAEQPAVAEQPIAQPAEEIVVEEPAEPAPWEEERQEEAAQLIAEPAATHAVEEPARAETKPVEPPLVFESYHMIDYFASQGIKLAPDENPTDRLGKQMKSFTEWLKVMKRLPQKEAGGIPDIVAENRIQAIAAHSNEGKEVLTETMAEVLAMQGMREKASEVYHKLSLLNPDKSGYFAEKIEQLKAN